jgi:epoxide hydrolase-like predicted phosphatase
MSTQKDKDASEDYIISKIFGWQKVKLYNLKHFIFDFGGVLIERTFVLKNLFEMIENDLNISLPLKEDPSIKTLRRRLTSGRISAREFLEKLFKRYFYSNKEMQGIKYIKKPNVQYYLELWFHLYSHMTQFSIGMAEIIERLHKTGYIVSLMSNTYDIHAKSNELKGFYETFDSVFLSNEIGLIKPNLEKYKYVLNKLDTKPKNCVFIDDKIRNLFPARELGMNVIRFNSLDKFKEQLNELGIKKIGRFQRKEIKKKYKHYKIKKKKMEIAKDDYKKAKKEFLKKKGRSLKRKKEYEKKRDEYYKKKFKFNRKKKKKKQDFVAMIHVD